MAGGRGGAAVRGGSNAVRGGWPLGEPGIRLLFLAMTVQIHVTLRLGRWGRAGDGGRGPGGKGEG